MKLSSGESDQPPFLAFATGDDDTAALRAFAAAQQWPESSVHQGDIRAATEFLKSNPSPAVLLVELPSAKEAPELLDALANACDPATKVITAGAINEYSFYCWLMDLGVSSYLLKPLSESALENAYLRSMAPPGSARPERPPGKVIAVMGTRGGVGASTVALNLAGIIASLSRKNIALVDVDPQEGSIALMLDIEPSRGLRDVLEKPDRIDSLFIERVMTKPLKNLSVLSAEEALHDHIHTHEQAADALLREVRGQFDIVLLDVPRSLSHFNRECLKQAESVVLVTDLTLLALRDALRIGDLLRETLKVKPPLIVANRVGVAPRQEMPPGDFEKGVGGKIVQRVAFAPDVFMQTGSEIPAVKFKTNMALKPLYALASQLVPEAKIKPPATDKKALRLDIGMFKKKKAE